MDAERQQGRLYQRLLFEESAESLRHGAGSEGGTRPSPHEEPQAFTANGPARALTEHLMEEVADRENLNRAYRQVKVNRGAAGADGMTIAEAAKWIAEHKPVADRFLAGRQLPTATGSRGANPQTGRRNAAIGHPDGD